MIYPDIVKEASPILLASTSSTTAHPDPHPIACVLSSNPIIAAEALEAFYQCNTFILDLDPYLGDRKMWIHDSIPRSYIRHLVVVVEEETWEESRPIVPFVEFEQKNWNSAKRRRWIELLTFPKLETLTVNMVKKERKTFFWMFFSPILYELRARNSGFQIRFNVSFDQMLEEEWNSSVWGGINGLPVNEEFKPSGFIEVSGMFVPATDDDRQYVDDYLPEKIMPAARDVISGLFAESPARRRDLGSLYFVSEPPLLRVLMDEHWVVFKDCEKQRGA